MLYSYLRWVEHSPSKEPSFPPHSFIIQSKQLQLETDFSVIKIYCPCFWRIDTLELAYIFKFNTHTIHKATLSKKVSAFCNVTLYILAATYRPTTCRHLHGGRTNLLKPSENSVNDYKFLREFISLCLGTSVLRNVLLSNLTLYCWYQSHNMFRSFQRTIIRHIKHISNIRTHARWILIICWLTSIVILFSIFVALSGDFFCIFHRLIFFLNLVVFLKLCCIPLVMTLCSWCAYLWTNVVTLGMSLVSWYILTKGMKHGFRNITNFREIF